MYDKTVTAMEQIIYKRAPKSARRFLFEAVSSAEKAGKKLLESYRGAEPLDRATVKELKTIYDEIADEMIKESIEKSFTDHS